MPRKRTVAPGGCKVLWEEHTPQHETAADLFTLPASFPRRALSDEQLEAVGEWYNEWISGLLEAVRGALVCARTRSAKADAPPPVNLQNLQVHAVVLAHLLRLHPSAEESLPKLAEAMGVACRRLYYARDAILEQFGDAAVKAFRAQRDVQDVALEALACHSALDFAGAVKLSPRVLFIPYAGRTTTMQRFSIVQAVMGTPGIDTVRDDFMPDTTTHALRVTLKK